MKEYRIDRNNGFVRVCELDNGDKKSTFFPSREYTVKDFHFSEKVLFTYVHIGERQYELTDERKEYCKDIPVFYAVVFSFAENEFFSAYKEAHIYLDF